MSDLPQFGRHPDADQLNAFVEHVLPDHEQQEMLAHLATCVDCRVTVRLSLPSAEEVAASPPIRKRWQPGWNLTWAAVPAFAALALVLVHVYVRARLSAPASTPVQMAESRPTSPSASASAPVAQPFKKSQSGTKRSYNRKMASVVATKIKPQTLPRTGAPFLFAPQGDNATESFARDGVPRGDILSATLPIQLPIVSMVSKDHRRLAIDSRDALFLSNDDGGHWIAVSQAWRGRVVKVALTSASALADVVATGNLAPSKKTRALPSLALRQTPASSTLSGTVTDASGASIPEVTVTITNTTAQVQSAETDRDGHYRIGTLIPGRYRVEAQARGFVRGSVVVNLAPLQQGLADFKLLVGSATQSVDVTAASQALPVEALGVTGQLFEITTETGEHWVSADGQNWARK